MKIRCKRLHLPFLSLKAFTLTFLTPRPYIRLLWKNKKITRISLGKRSCDPYLTSYLLFSPALAAKKSIQYLSLSSIFSSTPTSSTIPQINSSGLYSYNFSAPLLSTPNIFFMCWYHLSLILTAWPIYLQLRFSFTLRT